MFLVLINSFSTVKFEKPAHTIQNISLYRYNGFWHIRHLPDSRTIQKIGEEENTMSIDEYKRVPARTVGREAFIKSMGTLASSVTVVTTDGIAGCHGATVSAFSSVSADPPTVLVCLHGNSRIAETVNSNRLFSVNVLPVSEQEIANRFAGRVDSDSRNRFEGIDIEACNTGPVIKGSTTFCCEVTENIVSGSHTIFIGRVLEVKGAIPEPLIYYSGNYHHLGAINVSKKEKLISSNLRSVDK
jgi:flavin reductase (DIM6/NTAB) family NADH-FMN oxidoreductase RutF